MQSIDNQQLAAFKRPFVYRFNPFFLIFKSVFNNENNSEVSQRISFNLFGQLHIDGATQQ
jgi:hypothetical protein